MLTARRVIDRAQANCAQPLITTHTDTVECPITAPRTPPPTIVPTPQHTDAPMLHVRVSSWVQWYKASPILHSAVCIARVNSMTSGTTWGEQGGYIATVEHSGRLHPQVAPFRSVNTRMTAAMQVASPLTSTRCPPL